MITAFTPLFQVDIGPILNSLPSHRHMFSFAGHAKGGALDHAASIYLRGPVESSVEERWHQDVPHKNYHALEHWPEMDVLLTSIGDRLFGGERHKLGKAMLVRLRPGGWIDWHVDEGSYADAHWRGHLPIVTNDGCHVFSGIHAGHLPPGHFFKFDNSALHSGINTGRTERIHLIVDWRKS